MEADEEGFKTNPVGSGPYKFVEWKQGDSVKLEAFDDYYAGAPATKYLQMKVIPEAAQRTMLWKQAKSTWLMISLQMTKTKLQTMQTYSFWKLRHCPAIMLP